MSDLLPCPFCGGRAELGHVKFMDGTAWNIRMAVVCTGEGCWATIQEYIGGDDTTERVIASWNLRTKQGDLSMQTTLTAQHLVALDCPPAQHAELLQTGASYEFVQGFADNAAGRRINFLALIAFIRKYGSLGAGLFAAYAATGFPGVLAFVAANMAQAPQIWADFLAIFAS